MYWQAVPHHLDVKDVEMMCLSSPRRLTVADRRGSGRAHLSILTPFNA
ncbi:hypothetical protein [Rhizobium sp. 9140]|nr:hypothetical protein [Rhizobium sp. 9140]